MDIEEDKNNRLASLCRSLGNISRVTIIQKVIETKSCVTEDLKDIGLSSSITEQHIKALKKEGLIKGRIARSKACYCINIDKLEEFKKLVDGLYNKAKQHENITCSRDGIS